jgi:hypothetical protein
MHSGSVTRASSWRAPTRRISTLQQQPAPRPQTEAPTRKSDSSHHTHRLKRPGADATRRGPTRPDSEIGRRRLASRQQPWPCNPSASQ